MIRLLLCCFVFFWIGLDEVATIPVDNAVEGDPEVECAATGIIVNFNTRNGFEGYVYAKGYFADDNCKELGSGDRQVAGLDISFDECGVRRIRSLNPKGVFVTVNVGIQFHPRFVTKVDRMYRVQCFYMEADKTIDTGIGISELTTLDLHVRTHQVPMPVCRYEILPIGGQGPPVEYAEVGDMVFHKWTCDSETQDTFCMVVHSCTVDNNIDGNPVQLIDDRGCAVDRYLLNNLEYPMDLMAGIEAHVFKFADVADLYFQCQVTILVKEPGETCPRPACPIPRGLGAGAANPQEESQGIEQPQHPFPLVPGSPYLPANGQFLRSARFVRSASEVGSLDVEAELTAWDLHNGNRLRDPSFPALPEHEIGKNEGICIPFATFFAFLTIALLLVLLTTTAAAFSVYRKRY